MAIHSSLAHALKPSVDYTLTGYTKRKVCDLRFRAEGRDLSSIYLFIQGLEFQKKPWLSNSGEIMLWFLTQPQTLTLPNMEAWVHGPSCWKELKHNHDSGIYIEGFIFIIVIACIVCDLRSGMLRLRAGALMKESVPTHTS